jgi:hypothetical protein
MFSSMVSSLSYLGIQVDTTEVGVPMDEKLISLRPTLFLSSDNAYFTSTVDWELLNRWRRETGMRVGLTASIEAYGNTALPFRLMAARQNGVDFFYSFRSREYLHERPDYHLFFEEGYKIHSIEFGANPLLYYPVPVKQKDIDYIFLASSNPTKLDRMVPYLGPVFSQYEGFIGGTGWQKVDCWPSLSANKFLFSRAKIGVNLHLKDQILWANEVNERTYILAACGIPQLTDAPKLLLKRFSDKSLFKAQSPKEYLEQFEFILSNPAVAEQRALQGLREVYASHTTFHRAESFVLQLYRLYHQSWR